MNKNKRNIWIAAGVGAAIAIPAIPITTILLNRSNSNNDMKVINTFNPVEQKADLDPLAQEKHDALAALLPADFAYQEVPDYYNADGTFERAGTYKLYPGTMPEYNFLGLSELNDEFRERINEAATIDEINSFIEAYKAISFQLFKDNALAKINAMREYTNVIMPADLKKWYRAAYDNVNETKNFDDLFKVFTAYDHLLKQRTANQAFIDFKSFIDKLQTNGLLTAAEAQAEKDSYEMDLETNFFSWAEIYNRFLFDQEVNVILRYNQPVADKLAELVERWLVSKEVRDMIGDNFPMFDRIPSIIYEYATVNDGGKLAIQKMEESWFLAFETPKYREKMIAQIHSLPFDDSIGRRIVDKMLLWCREIFKTASSQEKVDQIFADFQNQINAFRVEIVASIKQKAIKEISTNIDARGLGIEISNPIKAFAADAIDHATTEEEVREIVHQANLIYL